MFVPYGDSETQLGVIDCGSTIGTMIKLNGEYELQNGDVIHIGDRLEVEVRLTESFGSPYKGCMWHRERRTVVDYSQVSSYSPTVGNDSAGQTSEIEPSQTLLLANMAQAADTIDISASENPTGATTPESVDQKLCSLTPSDCDIISCHLIITIQTSQQPPKEEWVDPKGIVLGRGPHANSAYKKVSVTISNGYISREHCLIYYNGDRPHGRNWILRDISTLGTFLRLKTCSEPYPLPPGAVFKAGQCKVEVGPCDDQAVQLPEWLDIPVDLPLDYC